MMLKKDLFIIEGIATSGKTSIITLLAKEIGKIHSMKIVQEAETLMPLIHNTSKDVAVVHLKKIIEKIKRFRGDVIITDRFHFTHAFRTRSGISDFLEIEKELIKNFNCVIILLTVDLHTLKKRILTTESIRGDNWSKGKKGTIKDRVRYYSDQQKILLGFTKKTSLPIHIFDSTNKNWEEIVRSIKKSPSEKKDSSRGVR